MIERAKSMVGSVAGEIRTRPFRSLAKVAAGLGLVMMVHGCAEGVDSRTETVVSGEEVDKADWEMVGGAAALGASVFVHEAARRLEDRRRR